MRVEDSLFCAPGHQSSRVGERLVRLRPSPLRVRHDCTDGQRARGDTSRVAAAPRDIGHEIRPMAGKTRA